MTQWSGSWSKSNLLLKMYALFILLCFTEFNAHSSDQKNFNNTYNRLYNQAKYVELLKILEKKSATALNEKDSIEYLTFQLKLADVYRASHKHRVALKIIRNTEPYLISNKTSPSIHHLYNKLKGAIYFELKNHDLSYKYTNLALTISTESLSDKEICNDLIQLGAVFRSIDSDSSLTLLQKARKYAESTKDTGTLALSYINLAFTYSALNKIDSALHFSNRSLTYSNPAQIKVYQVMAYNQLVTYYDRIGDYTKAYEFIKIRERISSSYENEKQAAVLEDLTNALQKAEQEKEREVLLAQIKLEEELIKRKNIQLGLALFIFLVVLILAFNYYKTNKKQQKQVVELNRLNAEKKESIQKLKEVNRLKNKILSIIGHDLRAPFSNLISYLEIIEDIDLTPEDRSAMISGSRVAANNGLLMLDNLVYWANKNKDGFIYSPKAIDLKEVVNEGIEESKYQWKHKQQQIDTSGLVPLKVQSDPTLLSIIIRNLLSNAIKFSPTESTIRVSTEKVNEKAYIKIQDAGTGMPDSLLEELSKRNNEIKPKRGTEGEKGLGLGLQLCMSFAKLNHSKIVFSKNKAPGTLVEIEIPLT